MVRNILGGFILLSLVMAGFSSCTQVSAADDEKFVLISENGLQSIHSHDIKKAIDKVECDHVIKSILKDRAGVLLSYMNKMTVKSADTRTKVDDHLYISGIRSGIHHTDLLMFAKDHEQNEYRVIFRKARQRVYLVVEG